MQGERVKYFWRHRHTTATPSSKIKIKNVGSFWNFFIPSKELSKTKITKHQKPFEQF